MSVSKKEMSEKLNSLKDYYESEDYKGNYWDILAEDLNEYGADKLKEYSRNWDICENREFPLSKDSANKVIDYVIENLDEYVRDYCGYYVGDDSVASTCFGEIETEVPQGFNDDEHDDCGWYMGEESIYENQPRYMYLDYSSNGIHIKITQTDVYEILDILNDQMICDIIYSDQCSIEVYNSVDTFQWNYSGQWDTKLFSVGGKLIESENIKEYVDKNHFIIKSYEEV